MIDEGSRLLINKAVDVLNRGGIIIAPTDTVWGLMCDYSSEQAVKSIHNVKKSPQKPMAVLIDSLDKAGQLGLEIPATMKPIADYYWPGPLTLILKSKREDLGYLAGEGNSIGVRIPDTEELRELIRRYDKPLAATSANISGQRQPESFADITDDISMSADFICRFNVKPSGIASTVVDCTGDVFQIIREGIIDKEKLEKVVSKS